MSSNVSPSQLDLFDQQSPHPLQLDEALRSTLLHYVADMLSAIIRASESQSQPEVSDAG